MRHRKLTPSRRPLTAGDVLLLKEIRSHAAFERANFSLFNKSDNDPLPRSEAEVNEFIRRRTRLYLQTYVLSKLDRMIDRKEDPR